MTTHVTFQPLKDKQRLADLSDGYRVAAEAYRLAADLGCGGDLYDALFHLLQSEAKKVEAALK
jgi:hypothetical protein